MSMPGSADLDIFGLFWGDTLVLAVAFGFVEESRVDDAVRTSSLTLICY